MVGQNAFVVPKLDTAVELPTATFITSIALSYSCGEQLHPYVKAELVGFEGITFDPTSTA